jgi:hypothetical protein
MSKKRSAKAAEAVETPEVTPTPPSAPPPGASREPVRPTVEDDGEGGFAEDDEDEDAAEAAREAEADAAQRRRGARGRLDSLIPDILKKAIAQGAEAFVDEKLRESLVGDVVRRAIHVGNEVVDSTEDQFRKLLHDIPVPREVGDRVANRLDEYKGEMFRIVKQEVHEFLERVDLGAEMQKLLTSVSFEIVTEVRFIPNEKGTQGGGPGVKPEVKSGVRMKRGEPATRSRRSKPTSDET